MARGKGLVWRLLRVALPCLMRGLGPQDVRACELPPEPRAPKGPEQGARRALDRSRPLQCALPARPPSGARARPGRCGSDAAVAGTRLSSCEQLGHPAQAGSGDPGGCGGRTLNLDRNVGFWLLPTPPPAANRTQLQTGPKGAWISDPAADSGDSDTFNATPPETAKNHT